MKEKVKSLLIILMSLITGGSVTISILISLNKERPEITVQSSIELPNVFDESGNVVVENLPLVEDIDGGKLDPIVENLDAEERQNAVRGYVVDITTPQSFINATYGQCIYLNNPYGSQCYNTTALLMENQVGYWPSTCGQEGAKGIWDCKDYNSRGDGNTFYYQITNPLDLRPGDIWVSHNGVYGHTGMVADYPFYVNGVLYVPLYSTNQGGANCEYGGQASNIISMGVSTFSGALRWSGWDYLFEPQPSPVPISNCSIWNVKEGDTMSKIMMDCEGTLHYGEIMDNYAKSWYSLIYMPNQSVYDGWHSKNGVGLYAGDDIEKRN